LTAQFQVGKLDQAIARSNPATSPAHQQATAKITQWRKNWQVAEAQFSTAKSALDQGNWQVAIDESNKVPNISFGKINSMSSQHSPQSTAEAQQAQHRFCASQEQKSTGISPPYSSPPAPMVLIRRGRL